MKYGMNIALLFGILLLQQPVFGQEEKPPLGEQMKEVMEKGQTYNQFKVIQASRLQELFGDINSRLQEQEAKLIEASEAVDKAQRQLSESEAAARQLEKQLAQSQTLNDSISFLGITWSKSTYNVLVWGIIGLLVLAGVILYGMFTRSHKVTKNIQSDLQRINTEFETYKTRSHEKQVKLKRELQTAMNTLHEKGIKV